MAWRSPQFTYFQQAGGIDCHPVSGEITYGIERIAMYLQGVDSVYDLTWTEGVTYGHVHHRGEVECSTYNFEEADVVMLFDIFDRNEAEAQRLVGKDLVLPAYDCTLKCSHTFNMLDARGAISVTERTRFIGRVRDLARTVAFAYVAQREAMGHPLMGCFGANAGQGRA